MLLTGELLIGGKSRIGTAGSFEAIEAATGGKLKGSFGGATFDDLDETTKLAWAAFPIYHETGFEQRAAFLGKDCRTDCQYR